MRMIVVPLRWKLIVLFVAIVLMVTAATVAVLLHTWSMPVEQLLVDPRLRTLARVSVASALVWTVISAALASFYVHRITGPLSRVLQAAAAVEAGNLDVQVQVPESDEIGIFIARFNRLVATLKRQEVEKARLLEDLHRANAQLTGDVRRSERLAALGTLSAGLAHELNNLLNIISGYASVVRKEAGPDSRFQKDLDVILREASRASELLERFMMFARPARLRPVEADAAVLIRNCLAVLALSIERHAIELAVELPDEIPITCDPVPLEHAFFNVLLNAVQAMKQGGTLRVSARRTGGQGTCILIQDTGSGIRPEDLSKIFDPFFTTKGPGEGTGLGLAITHRVIEQHGGTVRVESEPGKGTLFELAIPAAPPVERSAREGEGAGDR